MMHHHVPLLAVSLVMMIHVFGTAIFNIYVTFPHFDIPMHFFGGFAIGILGTHVYDQVAAYHGIKSWLWWQELLFVMSFVVMVAVFWEFYEFILDVVVGRLFVVAKNQLSLIDTMGDLFFGWMGGVMAHVFRHPLAQFGLRFKK